LYTEYKPENSVDRLTAEANPRFLERVVKGSRFDVEFIFGCYHIDRGNGSYTADATFFPHVLQALSLLEHSTLGKNGSRGYGQVAFHFAEPVVVDRNSYRTGGGAFQQAVRTHAEQEDAFTYRVADLQRMNWTEKLQVLSPTS
ncbi:MAG: hypothetical protein D6685_00045, partial [Bacteroidetes bacterium]